jgi:hypothetical protein
MLLKREVGVMTQMIARYPISLFVGLQKKLYKRMQIFGLNLLAKILQAPHSAFQ